MLILKKIKVYVNIHIVCVPFCRSSRAQKMKSTWILLLSFALLKSTLAQFGGGFYGGGFFGGGYGCPSYLPTNGFQCYQPAQDNTVWCKGKMQLIRWIYTHVYIFFMANMSMIMVISSRHGILHLPKRWLLWWLQGIFGCWWAIITWQLWFLSLQPWNIPLAKNCFEKARWFWLRKERN